MSLSQTRAMVLCFLPALFFPLSLLVAIECVMRSLPIAILSCVFLMGAGPCDLFEAPIDSDSLDNDSDSASPSDCETPCADELRVVVVRSDNGIFQDGAYDFQIYTNEFGNIVINCSLWTFLPEQPLDCTYTGQVPPMLSLEAGGAVFALTLPVAPQTSTWIVNYSGAQIGRKDMRPSYEPQAETGCAADCVEADEVMAVEIP